MLSRHQNWYIEKKMCLVHSKFPTVIEAMIAVSFWVYNSNKRRIMLRRLLGGGVYWYFCSKMRHVIHSGTALIRGRRLIE